MNFWYKRPSCTHCLIPDERAMRTLKDFFVIPELSFFFCKHFFFILDDPFLLSRLKNSLWFMHKFVRIFAALAHSATCVGFSFCFMERENVIEFCLNCAGFFFFSKQADSNFSGTIVLCFLPVSVHWVNWLTWRKKVQKVSLWRIFLISDVRKEQLDLLVQCLTFVHWGVKTEGMKDTLSFVWVNSAACTCIVLSGLALPEQDVDPWFWSPMKANRWKCRQKGKGFFEEGVIWTLSSLSKNLA